MIPWMNSARKWKNWKRAGRNNCQVKGPKGFGNPRVWLPILTQIVQKIQQTLMPQWYRLF
jgi:hypothetical protein